MTKKSKKSQTMTDQINWFTPLLMGLAGAGHCLAMCGGLAAAMGVNQNRLTVFVYNLGRLTSYSLLGAIMGGAIALLAPDTPYTTPVLRIFAATMMILLGLYLAGWWPILVKLESLGRPVWRKLQPFAAKLRGQHGLLPAYLAGMFWGWLPCGLVYSALSYAAVSGSAFSGAGYMALFALGTFPAMIGLGLISQHVAQLFRSQGVRTALGVMMLLYGLWSLLIVIKALLQR